MTGGGREKRGEQGPEESGLIVAAAAVGGLPRRWGGHVRRAEAEGGLSAQPWVHLPPFLALPVVKFLCLYFSTFVSDSQPGCSISLVPIAQLPALYLSLLSARSLCISEPPRPSRGAAIII